MEMLLRRKERQLWGGGQAVGWVSANGGGRHRTVFGNNWEQVSGNIPGKVMISEQTPGKVSAMC